MKNKKGLFLISLISIFLFFSLATSPASAACADVCHEQYQAIKDGVLGADPQEAIKTLCAGSNCNTCSFCSTGTISLPTFFEYGSVEGGLGKFLNNIFILISVGAGLFALFNFFRAGYTYIAAKKEPEKIEDAMAQIVNSLIGLLIVAAAFLIAALAGQIFFGDATFILQPKIYGPGQ